MVAPVIERDLILAALIASLALGTYTCRRARTRGLGGFAPALLPGLVTIVWFLALAAGEHFGSLLGMAASGAASMGISAAMAARTPRRKGRRPFRWWWGDWVGFAAFAAFVFALNGFDLVGHYTIVGMYLRGNIPPTAPNDPQVPLLYHHLFDGAAAVVASATRLDPERSLDLVTVLCLFAVICALQGLSRALYRRRVASRLARLFFLFAIGPAILRDTSQIPVGVPDHQTFQPLIQIFGRRPMALNFVVFAVLLLILLPRFDPRARRRPALFAAVPACLLVPSISEELSLLLAISVAAMVLLRRIRFRDAAILGAACLVGLIESTTILSLLRGTPQPTLAPEIHLQWPPTLPTWRAPHDGIALFSLAALGELLLEWSPLFFLGLAFGLIARAPAQRALVGFAALGFLPAVGLNFGPWLKADLDRFLFYGGHSAFMLLADPIERLWRRGRLPRTAAALLGALAIAGTPIAAASLLAQWGLSVAPLLELHQRLRDTLAVVGPREQIAVPAEQAQILAMSGFVVVAPMDTNIVGRISMPAFAEHFARHRTAANWLIVRSDDPRLEGCAPAVAFDSTGKPVPDDGRARVSFVLVRQQECPGALRPRRRRLVTATSSAAGRGRR